MQAIILAAGSGRRFKSITDNAPKCLLEINGETILRRLINQIGSYGVRDIKIVVGYEKDKISKEVSGISHVKIKIIENERYNEDVNIYSLTLALKEDLTPCYIFEADCVFEKKCFDLIFDDKYKNKSVWYSMGNFTEELSGGIIGANAHGDVFDIKIVKKYQEEYKNYKKMVGVLKIGPNQIRPYSNYLFESCSKNISQYYHMPWIEHIGELESCLVDFGHLKALSFNTVEDYYKVKEVFANEAGKS